MNSTQDAFFTGLRNRHLEVSFDDVGVYSRHSKILPHETDFLTQFSLNVSLRTPMVSAAMDTVTEAAMATALAEEGGIGIIHKNLSPQEQRDMVAAVKRAHNQCVTDPVTIFPDMTVADVEKMRWERNLAFSSFPVIERSGGKLVGMFTGYDMRFATTGSMTVGELMTPFDPDNPSFVTASSDMSLQEVLALMRTHKRSVVPVVSEKGEVKELRFLSALVRWVDRESTYNLDAAGRLRVGAAVGVGDCARERAEILAAVGCDVLFIDTAHGNSSRVIDTVRELSRAYPRIDVAAGNVSTADGAQRLANAGASCVSAGQGIGSSCTTPVVTGVGRPQLSAIYECARALQGTGVPVCADGGIRSSGDILKALAAGAKSVMCGGRFAGTRESPGDVEYHEGVRVKKYRGMGSFGAMSHRGSLERYGREGDQKLTAEGVEGTVAYKGSVSDVVAEDMGGLRSGMAYLGASTLGELREIAEFYRVTPAGLVASHPHMFHR